ncbi:hypothetical protein LAZ67_16002331 [Cordylochernes scorpioides]|uniref:Uncharacterized protein n=1 Tax=Cordylochernes scorpioides TaxID=51811 RepID=A0ABY6LBX2_9ARAC|nr:hypothetical protein LAZ67_16002331 [Cordylochernes scorpioides]
MDKPRTSDNFDRKPNNHGKKKRAVTFLDPDAIKRRPQASVFSSPLFQFNIRPAAQAAPIEKRAVTFLDPDAIKRRPQASVFSSPLFQFNIRPAAQAAPIELCLLPLRLHGRVDIEVRLASVATLLAFTIIERSPDLQGWIFRRVLDDDALAILASAKTGIHRWKATVFLVVMVQPRTVSDSDVQEIPRGESVRCFQEPHQSSQLVLRLTANPKAIWNFSKIRERAQTERRP